MDEHKHSSATGKLFWLILALALGVRLAWVIYTPALPTSDFATYDALARGLAAGEGYPTMYRVPGYPLFLAGIYALFGPGLLAPKLANALMGTLTTALTYSLGRRLFDQRVGLAAAAWIALLPSHILYAGLLASETLFTFLLVAATALFLPALERRGWRGALLLAVTGFVLGLAALARPVALLIPGVWAVYVLFFRRAPWLRALVQLAWVGAVMTLTFAPWLVRNYRATGHLVLQTNGGYNWYMGFHPQADGYYRPELLREIRAEGQALGYDEREIDRLAYTRALAYIRAHPLRSLALAPLKWYHLFKHDVSGVVWNFREPARPFSPVVWVAAVVVGQGYYMLLMLAAVIGGWSLLRGRVLRRRYYPGYLLPLGYVLYWLFFHALAIGVDRFHIPLLPFIALFSGVGALALWDWAAARRAPGPPVTAQPAGEPPA